MMIEIHNAVWSFLMLMIE